MKRAPKSKSQATILVRELMAAGIPFKHQQALEIVAKMSGFRDLNTMLVAPEDSTPLAQSAAVPAKALPDLVLSALVGLAQNVINECDDSGCDVDHTVTSAEAVEALRTFVDRLELTLISNNPIKNFDPTRQIAIIWGAQDIQDIRPDLTESEAFDVLQYAKRKHDASYGVTWDTLRDSAECLFHVRTLPCTLIFTAEDGTATSKPAVVQLADKGALLVDGKLLPKVDTDGTVTASFGGIPDEEFPVEFGKLFGAENDDDGEYERNSLFQELMERMQQAKTLPDVTMTT